ncbi:ADP-heptose--LPS heptosyltransferase 2 [bacterium BMS3Abin07]|nr:ADP-heptose--LPS heptosyltransferase 2 [bacterium BMS3Abin07]GBE33054.1 ADP-heptose--LPS heptosyltransferase 2 [bacterium BMS3Bbin05]HDZ88474.1 glycosyltransferase family 9 protein [Nitrospirota bacterium]
MSRFIRKKGSSANPDKPFLEFDKKDSEDRVFSLLSNKEDVIAIFPGASVNERKWGGNNYGLVAGRLHKQGYECIVLGSAGDKDDAGNIRIREPDAVDLTGRTALDEVAYILKKVRLLITADSGLMHIACAVGTPTVSLFGSGIEKKWAPRGEKHVVINKHLACSPCTRFGYTPRCKRGVECLSSISVEEVYEATSRLLERTCPSNVSL